MTLFRQQDFIGASGKALTWKIACDDFTDDDWATIAAICAPKLPPFCHVKGVATGGLAFANAMLRYCSADTQLLLMVDDVWTTGYSMRAALPPARAWIGLVAFARGPLPPNVNAFMSLSI